MRLTDNAERVTWRPEEDAAVCTEQEGAVIITGGNARGVIAEMKKFILRNYWWPGAVQSDLISELYIRFTDGSSVSVYREAHGVTIFLHEDDKTTTSRWKTFSDLANLLPSEIRLLIEEN